MFARLPLSLFLVAKQWQRNIELEMMRAVQAPYTITALRVSLKRLKLRNVLLNETKKTLFYACTVYTYV